MPEQIRPLVICLFWQGQRILVAKGYDPLKREQFFRPLGGGIEFGNGKTIIYPAGLLEYLV